MERVPVMPILRPRLSSALLVFIGTTGLWASGPARVPRLWVWAWDRPEDLLFLQPGEAGVAYFAMGITVEPSGIQVRPRRANLRVKEGIPRIAVVRIDLGQGHLPVARQDEVLQAIQAYALVPGLAGLQIDCDAPRSQRVFYAELLRRIHECVTSKVPVTMTALASWCMGDHWIGRAPVDGAVAMLFQMGAESSESLAWLRRGRSLAGIGAQEPSWGISTDQPLPVKPPREAQVFVFHPRPWTLAAFRKVQEGVR